MKGIVVRQLFRREGNIDTDKITVGMHNGSR